MTVRFEVNSSNYTEWQDISITNKDIVEVVATSDGSHTYGVRDDSMYEGQVTFTQVSGQACSAVSVNPGTEFSLMMTVDDGRMGDFVNFSVTTWLSDFTISLDGLPSATLVYTDENGTSKEETFSSTTTFRVNNSNKVSLRYTATPGTVVSAEGTYGSLWTKNYEGEFEIIPFADQSVTFKAVAQTVLSIQVSDMSMGTLSHNGDYYDLNMVQSVSLDLSSTSHFIMTLEFYHYEQYIYSIGTHNINDFTSSPAVITADPSNPYMVSIEGDFNGTSGSIIIQSKQLYHSRMIAVSTEHGLIHINGKTLSTGEYTDIYLDANVTTEGTFEQTGSVTVTAVTFGYSGYSETSPITDGKFNVPLCYGDTTVAYTADTSSTLSITNNGNCTIYLDLNGMLVTITESTYSTRLEGDTDYSIVIRAEPAYHYTNSSWNARDYSYTYISDKDSGKALGEMWEVTYRRFGRDGNVSLNLNTAMTVEYSLISADGIWQSKDGSATYYNTILYEYGSTVALRYRRTQYDMLPVGINDYIEGLSSSIVSPNIMDVDGTATMAGSLNPMLYRNKGCMYIRINGVYRRVRPYIKVRDAGSSTTSHWTECLEVYERTEQGWGKAVRQDSPY